MIDVESHERAVEHAAYVSSEPGPGGQPLYEWIDVREVSSPRSTGLPSASACSAHAFTPRSSPASAKAVPMCENAFGSCPCSTSRRSIWQ